MRLLLIEDDKNLGKATAEGLREIYAVDWVKTAEEAQEALATTVYDLAVADINLPGISGLEWIQDLRQKKNALPVLFLTARDTVRHRVEGLNAGADDYLIKPFDLDELMARCAALTRRGSGQAQPLVTLGTVTWEPATGHLTQDGKTIAVSARERALLDCLIRNAGRPVSKDKIMESIYD